MPWYFFAIAAALFMTGAAVTQKKVLIKERALEFSATLAFLNTLLSIPFFFFIDYSVFDYSLLWYVFGAAILAGIAYLLVAKAVRHMDISTVSPLLVMGPAITALAAFSFLGERLSLMQIAGMVALLVGAYVLELKPHHSITSPLRAFWDSKYIHFILIALVLYALTGTIDRYLLGVRDMQIVAYLAFVHPLLLLVFVILLKFFHGTSPGIRHGLRDAGWLVLVVALFTMSHRIFQSIAVSIAFIGLVSVVKRSSALFTTIIGGELFHEKNLFRKMIATSIMVGGIMLVVL